MSVLLQSASGYGGLDQTPLARPGYYNEIIANVFEKDFLQMITNSRISERITACNQTVQILKAPEVGPWRPYQKNQELIPNQVTANAICLSICNAAYNAIKIDELDIHWACERWSQWEQAFLEATYESYVEMQREWVLGSMIMEADPKNKGTKAGKFGKINLGARGTPVTVNKDNLPLRLSDLQMVLKESLYWKRNRMFAVLPIQLMSVLVQSNFANAAWAGDCVGCSPAIDGAWDRQLMGFNIIETIHSPAVVEPDGRVCFYILAGSSEAYAYASDIIQGRIVSNPRTFGVEYQMLAVWGGKAIYPKALAVGYWTLEY